DPTLCSDDMFNDRAWISQGRRAGIRETACPISGDYSGTVPEESSLCAKIASDCNNPDIMFYTVSLCHNRSHIFERKFCSVLFKPRRKGIILSFRKDFILIKLIFFLMHTHTQSVNISALATGTKMALCLLIRSVVICPIISALYV